GPAVSGYAISSAASAAGRNRRAVAPQALARTGSALSQGRRASNRQYGSPRPRARHAREKVVVALRLPDLGDKPQEFRFEQRQLFADGLLEIGNAVLGRIDQQWIAGCDRPQVVGVGPRTRFDQKERQGPGLAVGIEHVGFEGVVAGEKAFE